MSHGGKWDRRFLELASVFAGWSKHPAIRVGAVLVSRDRRIIGTGYNGPAPGTDDATLADQDRPVSRTIHAELNALLFAIKSPEWATLYCTRHPCAGCAGPIVATGVRSVVIPAGDWYQDNKWGSSHADAAAQFREAGVELVMLWAQR